MKLLIFKSLITLILLAISCLYLWPNKAMEVLTFLAIIIALFRDDIYKFYLPPKLHITIGPSKFHFHETKAFDTRTGGFIEMQAWYGIAIENVGLGTAKNVD